MRRALLSDSLKIIGHSYNNNNLSSSTWRHACNSRSEIAEIVEKFQVEQSKLNKARAWSLGVALATERYTNISQCPRAHSVLGAICGRIWQPPSPLGPACVPRTLDEFGWDCRPGEEAFGAKINFAAATSISTSALRCWSAIKSRCDAISMLRTLSGAAYLRRAFFCQHA
jgi:hypothetical protein